MIYAYDGANGIEEMDASGNVTARYIQGAGIDEPLGGWPTLVVFVRTATNEGAPPFVVFEGWEAICSQWRSTLSSRP